MLITDLPLWEDCPLLQRIPPEVEIRRGATASGKEVFVLWDRVRNKQVSYEAAAFDQPTLDTGLAILGRSPIKPPSEVEADRLEASNAAVDEVKRQIETERAKLDEVGISSIMLDTDRAGHPILYISLKAGERYAHIAPRLPVKGDASNVLSAFLREAADAVDGMTSHLMKDPNAQGT